MKTLATLLACALLVLVACTSTTGGTVAPAAQTTASPTAAPSPTPTPRPTSDVGAVLCGALADLRSAHDDQIAPLIMEMGIGTTDMNVLRGADGQARLQAVATVVVRYADSLESAVYPAAPELVVALQEAYVGYGEGIVGLKKLADDPDSVSGMLLETLQALNRGRSQLDTAIDLAAVAKAAGALTCP